MAAAEKAGYTDIYKTELISLTAFEKLMGKKKFQEILGEYVVKPPGKLALVPNSTPEKQSICRLRKMICCPRLRAAAIHKNRLMEDFYYG